MIKCFENTTVVVNGASSSGCGYGVIVLLGCVRKALTVLSLETENDRKVLFILAFAHSLFHASHGTRLHLSFYNVITAL